MGPEPFPSIEALEVAVHAVVLVELRERLGWDEKDVREWARAYGPAEPQERTYANGTKYTRSKMTRTEIVDLAIRTFEHDLADDESTDRLLALLSIAAGYFPDKVSLDMAPSDVIIRETKTMCRQRKRLVEWHAADGAEAYVAKAGRSIRKGRRGRPKKQPVA